MPAPTTREDTRMAEQGETARQMSVDEAIQGVGKLHGVIESRVDPYWTRHNIGLMAARHAAETAKSITTDALDALALRTLLDDLVRLRAEGEALREALEKYGQHKYECACATDADGDFRFWFGPGPDPIHCTCGFTAALAAPRAEDGTDAGA